MLKVTKFGGSSLCDSAGFSRVREIVLADLSLIHISEPTRH